MGDMASEVEMLEYDSASDASAESLAERSNDASMMMERSELQLSRSTLDGVDLDNLFGLVADLVNEPEFQDQFMNDRLLRIAGRVQTQRHQLQGRSQPIYLTAPELAEEERQPQQQQQHLNLWTHLKALYSVGHGM